MNERGTGDRRVEGRERRRRRRRELVTSGTITSNLEYQNSLLFG